MEGTLCDPDITLTPYAFLPFLGQECFINTVTEGSLSNLSLVRDQDLARRITIFRENGKLFIEQTFKDGNSFKRELLEKKSPLGWRLDKLEGSNREDQTKERL
ncbi:MAG: hypothetical protein D6704_01455 [Nitrospirae bacterium]|nr:MAG: hypothetical protein D6704_01455 [Nitrospirota bacterium]